GQRTAAATAVAAKYLAGRDGRVATIVGTGNQAKLHAQALTSTLPLETIYIAGREPTRTEEFAAQLSEKLKVVVLPARDLRVAFRKSHVIVTCTPSTEPLIGRNDLAPGKM